MDPITSSAQALTTVAPTVLQTLWFILIAVLLTGYFILDGFDLGIGVLYPFLAKDEEDKALLRAAIGPVWDGNEVWLLTAGGALFAAFAPAYATTFSGFYLAIMLVLFGLIARAAAIELRHYDQKWAKFYDVCFFVGSLVPALLFGVALGNVVRGLPLDSNGDYIGGFFALLNPFALLTGILGLLQCLVQGASFAALKVPRESSLYQRVLKLRSSAQWTLIIVAVLATAATHLTIAPVLVATPAGVLRLVFAVVLASGLILGRFAILRAKDLLAFIASCLNSLALIGLCASTLWPNLVPATNPELSITVAGAGGTDLALTWMTIIAAVGVPLVLFYHYLVYKTFNGRISLQDLKD
jgi:cytochrome d ubiquinol oxidase subunit II